MTRLWPTDAMNCTISTTCLNLHTTASTHQRTIAKITITLYLVTITKQIQYAKKAGFVNSVNQLAMTPLTTTATAPLTTKRILV